jgi:hypothetical protein
MGQREGKEEFAVYLGTTRGLGEISADETVTVF